ncbi:hypothetical protein O1611_g1775 [Lasiodiplodia mahajangana]|uniref:Uncharacterized protein n=1 Tax=Lasiodiplodia mahajangana TaxID=1108764 RepID=A0ACC2JX18_9PEZI|nr:hypothetical protein O1611_g1775 [Lasiodiplodia mahajangana]
MFQAVGSKALSQDTASLIDPVLENEIVNRLVYFTGQDTRRSEQDTQLLRKLVTYFETQIKSIIHHTLREINQPHLDLWRIAEGCHSQASPGGVLDPALFPSLGPVAGTERLWISFWVDFVHECPGGPTLFHPPAEFEPLKPDVAQPPRYLFRVYESPNYERDNCNVFASRLSSAPGSERSKINLLSLGSLTATQKLQSHMNWGKTGEPSNLVSWTSSLLFALQLAIFKCPTRKLTADDVQVCVIDTTKFPRQQFVDSIWLIRNYRGVAREIGGETQEYFYNTRHELSDEQNGEYFSQGTVNHSGRSCTSSLQSIIDAGLYDLYPEFNEPEGRKAWADRVTTLRSRWNPKPQITNLEELQIASKITSHCFGKFGADMALMLLAFKNRHYVAEFSQAIEQCLPVTKADHRPIEVDRFMVIDKAMRLYEGANGNSGQGNALFGVYLLA